MNKEEFFKRFRSSLDLLEQDLTIKGCTEDYTNIFILGLPRSGTTLLSQIIHSATNCSVSNNLIARFWDNPLVGSHISKFTVENNANFGEYESFLGQTRSIDEPHEFSLFWQKTMGYALNDDGLLERVAETDLKKLRIKLLNFNNIFQGPAVWKPLELLLYDIESVASSLDKSIFVFIDRSYKHIASSIYEARMNSSDPRVWWGSAPLKTQLPNIGEDSIAEQVVQQVSHFRNTYKKKLDSFDSERKLIIRFDELCESPNDVLQKIKKISDDIDGKIQIKGKLEPLTRKPTRQATSETQKIINRLDVLMGNNEYLFDNQYDGGG